MNEILPDINNNYYAEICFCGELDTVSSLSGFKKVVAGNSCIEKTLHGFSYSDNKLTKLGTQQKEFAGIIIATVSHSGSEAKEVVVRILKNGSSEILHEVSVNVMGLIPNKLYAEFETSLSPGDEVELYTKLINGNETIKISNLKLTLVAK